MSQVAEVLKSVGAHSFNHSLSPSERFYAVTRSCFASREWGGIVRKVPSKPARIGNWHYQGVVTLPNGVPLLVYTRTHNTSVPRAQ